MPLLLMIDRSLGMLGAGPSARHMETVILGVSAALDTIARLDADEHISLCVFNDQVEPIKLPADDIDALNTNYVRRVHTPQAITRLQRVTCESVADLDAAVVYASKECTQKWHSCVPHHVLIVTQSTADVAMAGLADLAVVRLDRVTTSDAIVADMTNRVQSWYSARRRSTTLRMGQMPVFALRLHPPIDLGIVDILGFVQSTDVRDAPLVSRHSMTAVGGDGVQPRPYLAYSSQGRRQAASPSSSRTRHNSSPSERRTYVHFSIEPCSDEEDYALVTVCEDSLSLDVLPPGASSVPWLGDLTHLGIAPVVDLKAKSITPLPVVDVADEMSYAQTALTNWTSHTKLQDDFQKVLRALRRERYPLLYDELSRVMSHALVLGSLDLVATFREMLVAELATNANLKNANVQRHGNHILGIIRREDYKHGVPIPQPLVS